MSKKPKPQLDIAMEAVMAFPNFMCWLLRSPSGLAARPLSPEARKAKYEDEFGAVLARVAELNADLQEAKPCGH